MILIGVIDGIDGGVGLIGGGVGFIDDVIMMKIGCL